MVTIPSGEVAVGGPRYLLYTNECVGLGHLRRTMNLAEAVTRRDARASALIITGAAAMLGGCRHPRIDTVKLPELARTSDGDLHAARLRVELRQVHNLRANLALAAARSFSPSVALVDKTPLGLDDELVPTLEALRSAGGTRLVLGLRDIEDTPEAVRGRWDGRRLKATITRLYDAILVYGPPGGLDVLGCLGLDSLDDIGVPVHHVGYVGSPLPATGSVDIPAGYLLVTAGGGADGYPVFDAVLESLSRHPRTVPIVMVCGPLMPAAHRAAIHARAAVLGVRVEDARDDMPAVIVGARGVIAMAGYNTVSEIVRAGSPVLLVPRTGPSGEQAVRAAQLRDADRATVLSLDQAAPEVMARAIDELLRADHPVHDPALHDGADRAAAILCELADRPGARAFGVDRPSLVGVSAR